MGIYGGFAGGETTLDERDWLTNETILSGDLNGDDVQVPDPRDLLNEPTRAENSYHVVTGSGTDATAVLDGFTITAGNANGTSPENRGGGMYNDNGSPTVTNCTFSGNSAESRGGGMFNDSGSPTVTNCTFSGNWADDGGGMNNFSGTGSNPTVTNCTFSGNSADDGGGMENLGSSPTVTNCTFTGNSADWNGGGMSNFGSSPTLTNCTFSGNWADDGGGMNNLAGDPNVTNCTFSGNWADDGGGMYNLASDPNVTNCTFSGNWADDGGGMSNFGSSPTLTNCIFWGNSDSGGTDEPAQIDGGTPVVTYSCVQGLNTYAGNENIGDDPLFVNADDNLRLSFGSPCIDAGDNTAVPGGVTTDLDGNPRFIDDPCTPDTGNGTPPIVDMGAYEFREPAMLEATVDLDPDVFEVKPEELGKPKKPKEPKEPKEEFLEAFIELLADVNVADVDANTVTLSVNDITLATAELPVIVDNVLDVLFPLDPNNVGIILGLEVTEVRVHGGKIKVEAIAAPSQSIDLIKLTVSGDLIDGGSFSGTDAVRVMLKEHKKHEGD